MIQICSTGFLSARTCASGVHRALGDLTARTIRVADAVFRYTTFGILVAGVPYLFASGGASMFLLVYLPGGIFVGSLASVAFLASSMNNNPNSLRNPLKADLIARILLWSSLILGGLYCGFAAHAIWNTVPFTWAALQGGGLLETSIIQASIGLSFITFVLAYAVPLPGFITNNISIFSLMQTLVRQSLFAREGYDQLHERLRDNIQALEVAHNEDRYGATDLISNLSIMMRENPPQANELNEVDRALEEIFAEFPIPEEGEVSDREVQQRFADRARNMSDREIQQWVGRFPNVLNFRFLASFLPREKLDQISPSSLESNPVQRGLFLQMTNHLGAIERDLIPWERNIFLWQNSHELQGEIEAILEILTKGEKGSSELMKRIEEAKKRLEGLRGRVHGADARCLLEKIEETARSFSYFVEYHHETSRLEKDLEAIRKQVSIFKHTLYKEKDLEDWRRGAKEYYEIVGRYAKDLINFSVFLKQLLGGDLPQGYENLRGLDELQEAVRPVFRLVWDDQARASRGNDLRSRLHNAIYVENLDQNHPMAFCYEILRRNLSADDFGRLGALLDIPEDELQPDTKTERTVRELISYGLKTRADLELVNILEPPEHGISLSANLIIERIVAFCKSRPRVDSQGVRLPWRIQFPLLPSLPLIAGRVFDTALCAGLIAAQVLMAPKATAIGFAVGGVLQALMSVEVRTGLLETGLISCINMSHIYPPYQDYMDQSISTSMRSLFWRVSALSGSVFLLDYGGFWSGMRHAFALRDGYDWLRERMRAR